MPRWPAYFIFATVVVAKPFDTGCVQGTITNESGPVVKASVEIRNIMTGFLIHTESDAHGAYTFSSLRAGRYSLWVQAPGNDSVWIPDVFVENGHITHEAVRLDRQRLSRVVQADAPTSLAFANACAAARTFVTPSR
jgi:hypothetical protein